MKCNACSQVQANVPTGSSSISWLIGRMGIDSTRASKLYWVHARMGIGIAIDGDTFTNQSRTIQFCVNSYLPLLYFAFCNAAECVRIQHAI